MTWQGRDIRLCVQ